MAIPVTNLTAITSKIRRITARPSTNQITDAEILEYIDTYYLYDFPQELKSFNLKTTYSFTTVPNEDTYTFPRNTYYSIEGPIYLSGYNLSLFENRDLFYRTWPQLLKSEDFATITAAIGSGPYVNIVTARPILRRTVTLSVDNGTGNYQVAYDVPLPNSNLGLINGAVSAGTINYLTGQISLTWTIVPAAGQVINIKYFPYEASQPLAMLFYHDTFILRPVPNEVYTVSMQAFIKPSALFFAGDQPYLEEWFELLAYGASLKIFAENMDMNNYQLLLPIYQQKLRECERRTIMQIKNQRSATIYGDSTFINPYRLPTA